MIRHKKKIQLILIITAGISILRRKKLLVLISIYKVLSAWWCLLVLCFITFHLERFYPETAQMTEFKITSNKKKNDCTQSISCWFTTPTLQKCITNVKEMGLSEVLLQFSCSVLVKQQNCSQYFADISYFLHFNFTGEIFWTVFLE